MSDTRKVRMVRQHEPLRVPQHWNTEDRSLVIQLNGQLDEIYAKLGEAQKTMSSLGLSVESEGEQITALNPIEFGTSAKSIDQNLADYWTTYIPNDGVPHLVCITALYGRCVGFLSRYSDVYGSGCLTRYEGTIYRVCLDNGSVSNQPLALNRQLATSYEEHDDWLVSSESGSGSVLFIQKMGKMIILNLRTSSRTHTDNDTIANLPVGYRPIVTIDVPAWINGSGAGVCRIASDGAVRTWLIPSGTASAGRVYLYAAYLIA